MNSSQSSLNKSPRKLEVLDATLREQTFGVSFSVGEKLAIVSLLDRLGVSFVESSLPDGNPTDFEYFQKSQSVLIRGSEAVGFLRETPSHLSVEKIASIPAQVKHVSLRANCWRSHLTEGFSQKKMGSEENLEIVKSRLSSLRSSGKDVFLYAQHFFDGFFEDTTYALNVLETSIDSDAVSRVVLCDSRGSCLPEQISKAVKLVHEHLSSKRGNVVGIHCHNDLGLAVSNTISAVEAGATHVQGTVNGLGERSGNADLCQLLPILILKLGFNALNSPAPREQQLMSLKTLSEKVSEASRINYPLQPLVGSDAFAHSDPVHIAEVNRSPESYEVLNPAQVGNSRLLGVDDASLIINEMWELGLYTKEREEIAKKVLSRMHELEAFGCKFDDAKASLHLLILENLGFAIWPFQVTRWETSTVRTVDNAAQVSGTIEITIGSREGEPKKLTTTARGVGPIHAIDLALRQSLENEFPELKKLKLTSYSLNIVDSLSGTAAAARARTEFSDEEVSYTGVSPSTTWATTSVSEDVLDASIKALIDGYRYKLIFRSRTERYTLPDWRLALGWRYSERI